MAASVSRSAISLTSEYIGFRSSVQRKLINVKGKAWKFYDFGPRNVDPLVMVHGTATTPDCFFYQLLTLGNKGYRVVAVQSPTHYSHETWCEGFAGFLRIFLGEGYSQKVHLFGTSLGGFLCLHFAHRHPGLVASLVLTNTYCDNESFKQNSTCLSMFRWLPEFYLKKYVLDKLPETSYHPDAIDFVVEQVETLTKEEVSSRLTLVCLHSEVGRIQLAQERISFIDTNDEVVGITEEVRQKLYDRFPGGNEMLMKGGGDFPFLSSPQEFSMLLQVHLRRNGLFPKLYLSDDELRKEKTLMSQAIQSQHEEHKMPSNAKQAAAQGSRGRSGTHFFSPEDATKDSEGVDISVVTGEDADTVVIGGGGDSDSDDLSWMYQ